jgi:ATP-dependent DNA helicase RecG
MNETELRHILEEGEGQFIEFKENFSKHIVKDIVAFANASGGRIFIGINDENKIRGIEITNDLKSKIVDIGKNCDPKIVLNLEEYENILIIEVEEGKDKPYQCSNGFYLRIGYNSQKLLRDEIIQFCIYENKIRFDEQICEHFDFSDFDDEKFEYYLKLARISKSLERDDILRSLHVLTDKGMTNAGVLFFAKKPFKYIMTSRIRCVLFKGNDRVHILDKKEVDKGIIGNIEFAVRYLEEHVPVRFEIKGLYRKEFPQFPKDAYREAVVNAVIHRDFFDGGEVAIEKMKDFIYINNPGGLVPYLKKEEFGKVSKPRNTLLADLLSRTYFMEKVGTGIKRIQEECKKNNNKVEITPSEHHFHVTLESFKEERMKQGSEKSSEKSSEKILSLIRENPKISAKEISEIIGISSRAVEKNIAKLKEKGFLKRVGPAKGGYWKMIK